MRTYIPLLLALLAGAAYAGPPVAKSTLAVSGTSASVKIGSRKVAFYCDVAVRWRASTSAPEAAVATDFPLAASQIAVVQLNYTFTHLSVIRETTNGNCYFWGMQ